MWKTHTEVDDVVGITPHFTSLKITGFTNAAFKELVDGPTGLALRGLAVRLLEDTSQDRPQSANKNANLLDLSVGRQRRVARSTFLRRA